MCGNPTWDSYSSDHDQHNSSSKSKEAAKKELLFFMPSNTSRKKRKIDSRLTQEKLLEDEVESYFAEERERMECDVLGYWKNEHRSPGLLLETS